MAETTPLPARDMALLLVDAGYHLAPVTIRRDARGRKRPDYHGMSWDQVATADPERVAHWFTRFGADLGMLISCGSSGIVVLDLDLKRDEDGRILVDAVEWWAQRGLPCSPVRVDTPSGGQHHYWRMPAGATLPNSTGAIGPGVDIRGEGGHVFAPGTRVVGDGDPYRLIDPLMSPEDLPELPEEIVKLIPEPRRRVRERPERAAGARTKDRNWVVSECRRQLDLVRAVPPIEGSGFRGVLMGAAMVLGRAVAAGIVTRSHSETRLAEAVTDVWGHVNAEDREWIDTGLDDGEADPWSVVETEAEAAVAEQERTTPDPDEDPDSYDRAVEVEARKLQIRQDAKDRLAARAHARRPSLASLVLDAHDLDQIPAPSMLIGEVLPEASVGLLAGKFGTYKSFVAMSWACSLAAGQPWLERVEEFPVPLPRRVLYLAAEGATGMRGRHAAWAHRYGSLGRGMLSFLPRPVNFTSAPAIEELGALVGETDARLLVVDTLHRSAPDAEENSSTEMGAVFEAAARMRDTYGVTVLFLHHTGHSGARGRGTSALEDDADFSYVIELDGESRDPSVQRTLRVRKRKDLSSEGSWPLRLIPVETVGSAYIDIGRVTDCGSPFHVVEDWNRGDQPPVPADIVGYRGSGQAALAPMARFMRHNAQGGIGMSLVQARTAVMAVYTDANGVSKYSRDTVERAWGALVEIGRIVADAGQQVSGRSFWLPRPGDPQ